MLRSEQHSVNVLHWSAQIEVCDLEDSLGCVPLGVGGCIHRGPFQVIHRCIRRCIPQESLSSVSGHLLIQNLVNQTICLWKGKTDVRGVRGAREVGGVKKKGKTSINCREVFNKPSFQPLPGIQSFSQFCLVWQLYNPNHCPESCWALRRLNTRDFAALSQNGGSPSLSLPCKSKSETCDSTLFGISVTAMSKNLRTIVFFSRWAYHRVQDWREATVHED